MIPETMPGQLPDPDILRALRYLAGCLVAAHGPESAALILSGILAEAAGDPDSGVALGPGSLVTADITGDPVAIYPN